MTCQLQGGMLLRLAWNSGGKLCPPPKLRSLSMELYNPVIGSPKYLLWKYDIYPHRQIFSIETLSIIPGMWNIYSIKTFFHSAPPKHPLLSLFLHEPEMYWGWNWFVDAENHVTLAPINMQILVIKVACISDCTHVHFLQVQLIL